MFRKVNLFSPPVEGRANLNHWTNDPARPNSNAEEGAEVVMKNLKAK
jgi:hypothetical protein